MSVETLVTPEWLSGEIKKKDSKVRVLDVSWYMPAWKRDPKGDYAKEHIPGAVLFDLMECRDLAEDTNPLKLGFMLPTSETFGKYCGARGIADDTHVVVYDDDTRFGMFSSQRAWYLFRAMGHDKVSILDGGLERWKAEGKEVTAEVPSPKAVEYVPSPRPHFCTSYDAVLKNLDSKDFLLVDGRPEPRFKGAAPEPNPKIKPGHIPDAKNLPFMQVMDGEKKRLKSAEELNKLFDGAGVDLSKPTVFTCGSGLTASHLVLAAYVASGKDIPLFCGAWSEWFQKAPASKMVDVPK